MRSPSSAPLFATAAALAISLMPQHAEATSIELNPVTPLGVISILDNKNPAYGGCPSEDMVRPVVVAADPTLSIAQVYQEVAVNASVSIKQVDAAAQRRQLEVTSTDLLRLEQYFQTSMEKNVNTIYQKYASSEYSPAPWPSSYWPVYEDSINHRWSPSQASPAEKYAKAYGLDPKSFMDKVSSSLGIDSQATASRVCLEDAQCDKFRDGSACAKREGSTSGYCIPMWYGICHAWAPASILEEEPRCEVIQNGVTFKPFDIKALLTVIYDGVGTPVVFTGARYDGSGSDRDEYGRYTDAAERDLGPGFFHIAVTNIMGRFKKSFVVDVNADAQVWNQPVRSYTTTQPVIMTPKQAAQKFFNVPKYPFNSNAKSIAYVQMTFKYVLEYIVDGPLVSTGLVDQATTAKNYTYLLELDTNKNIIGGEWIGDSQTDHPDFLWFSTSKPDSDAVTELGVSYRNVSELLKQSVACSTPAPSSTPTPTPTPSQTPAPTTTAPTPVPSASTPAPSSTTTQPTTAPSPTAPAPVSGTQCGSDQTGPQPCPTGEYCQPWNPSFYQCRRLDAKCGKQETGVDYNGADIATFQLLLPEQCCDKCVTTAGCKAYTFVNYNPDGKAYCYLKSGTGQRTNKVGVVSAAIVSTQPTSAPVPTSPSPVPAPSAAPGPASGNYCGNDQVGVQACPNGEYCQPWNPSFYQCRRLDAKCGKQEVGVDFYGADIATHQLLLPEQCCDKCATTAGCKAYTFVNYNPDGKAYCYLKSGTGQRSKKAGVVSAALAPRRLL